MRWRNVLNCYQRPVTNVSVSKASAIGWIPTLVNLLPAIYQTFQVWKLQNKVNMLIIGNNCNGYHFNVDLFFFLARKFLNWHVFNFLIFFLIKPFWFKKGNYFNVAQNSFFFGAEILLNWHYSYSFLVSIILY